MMSSPCTSVRWPRVIHPATLRSLALLFLISAILNTRRHGVEAWKAGILATLFHGIDEDGRRLLDPLNEVDDMEGRLLTRIDMQLINGAAGWRLVPVDQAKNS